MVKFRKFSESYLKMGFTSVLDNGKEKPRCVLCCLFCPQQQSNKVIKASASPAAEAPRACRKDLHVFKEKNSC